MLNLEGCSCYVDLTTSKKFCLQVRHDVRRTFFMYAESQAAMQSWIDAINRVVNELKYLTEGLVPRSSSVLAVDSRAQTLLSTSVGLRATPPPSLSFSPLQQHAAASASASSLLSAAAVAGTGAGSVRSSAFSDGAVALPDPAALFLERATSSVGIARKYRPVHAGVLAKESFTTRYLKDRYFELYYNILVYYKTSTDSKRDDILPLGAICLIDTLLSIGRHDPIGRYSLRLYHPQRRVYFLHPRSDRDLAQWSKALRRAMRFPLGSLMSFHVPKKRQSFLRSLGDVLIDGAVGFSALKRDDSESIAHGGPNNLRRVIPVRKHLIVPRNGAVLFVTDRADDFEPITGVSLRGYRLVSGKDRIFLMHLVLRSYELYTETDLLRWRRALRDAIRRATPRAAATADEADASTRLAVAEVAATPPLISPEPAHTLPALPPRDPVASDSPARGSGVPDHESSSSSGDDDGEGEGEGGDGEDQPDFTIDVDGQLFGGIRRESEPPAASAASAAAAASVD